MNETCSVRKVLVPSVSSAVTPKPLPPWSPSAQTHCVSPGCPGVSLFRSRRSGRGLTCLDLVPPALKEPWKRVPVRLFITHTPKLHGAWSGP